MCARARENRRERLTEIHDKNEEKNWRNDAMRFTSRREGKHKAATATRKSEQTAEGVLDSFQFVSFALKSNSARCNCSLADTSNGTQSDHSTRSIRSLSSRPIVVAVDLSTEIRFSSRLVIANWRKLIDDELICVCCGHPTHADSCHARCSIFAWVNASAQCKSNSQMGIYWKKWRGDF